MPLVKAKCPNCGANIEVDNTKDALVCDFCSSAFIVEKAINNYNITLNGQFNTDNTVNRLYENAKTFQSLGENEKAIETFRSMTEQYPADYRGWFGLLDLADFKGAAKIYEDACRWYSHAINLADDAKKSDISSRYNKWCNDRYAFLCQKYIPLKYEDFYHMTDIIGISENEPFYKDGILNAHKCNNKSGVFDALGINKNYRTTQVDHHVGWDFDGTYNIGFDKFLFINGRLVVLEYSGKVKKDTYRRVVIFTNDCVIKNNIDTYIGSLSPGTDRKEEGGCYIATCVYGTYDCPNVWTLRRFRDYTLDRHMFGRLFIKFYYAISPRLVKLFGNTNWFRSFWKKKLDKLVKHLNERGVSNAKYIDKY